MLHRWGHTKHKRKYVVSKKCHGRSCTRTSTLKRNRRGLVKRKESPLGVFVSFCKLYRSEYAVLKLQSLIRLTVRGSPLRTYGSSNEISTMNIVTKYPTSTVDKIRPQPRGGPTNHRRDPSGRCFSQPIETRDSHPRGEQASLGHS